ncbi:coatomer subunit zeta-1 isoform X2 [Protopterus annectens]|uniref:coatomer subunit zeta-1 isoform X2 n=1 Tax=Protopterus annectens TaxID=7888 RepID=UPI001CF976DA|nr:coatomer subunit zeta-1 isoform X2 [Protopterus annectens]
MDALILEPSLYTVKAVLILDNDGERLFAKYYDDTYPTVKEQKAFEKNIFNKTHRTDSEIALLEGLTVVYKSNIDLYFYVIGSSHENELMLMAVLNCLFDSLSQMLRKNVEKRALMDNMEGLFLAVDEIVDGGVILESDPQQVVHRVALRMYYARLLHLQRSAMCSWFTVCGSCSEAGFCLQYKVMMFLLQNRLCLRCYSPQRSRSSGLFFDKVHLLIVPFEGLPLAIQSFPSDHMLIKAFLSTRILLALKQRSRYAV